MYNPKRVENMTTDEKLCEIIKLLEEISKKLDSIDSSTALSATK